MIARSRRTTVVLATVLAVFVATVGTAFAYWLSSGTGTGSATSNVLNAPTNVAGSQTTGTGTVTVTWNAPATGVAPLGYFVTRNDGVSDSPACGTNAASTITAQTCNDLSVPIGSYTYTVTAVYRSWTATSDPSLSVPVLQSAQAITFTSNPVNPVYGGTYTPMANGGGSGNPVTFSSATPAVCTYSAGVVTFVATGTCTINADQAGSTYYTAAPTTPQTFTVGKASQTITFTPPASGVVFGTSPLSATATSGLTVSFTSATTSVCTVSGTTVTYVASGTCTINADQGGNANYNAAPQVQQNISVSKADQTITSFVAPSSGVFGGSGSLTGTASSGLTVTFSSLTPAVCTVSGSTVNYIDVGNCTVAADQAGDSNHYNAAPQVTQTITVGKASQTISWPAPPSSGLVGQNATLSATASSGLTVSFSSETTSVCTVSGTTVNYVGAGTCILDADQGGDSHYFAAPQVQRTFTVNKQAQTITFGALGGKTFGDADFAVSATASSTLTVSFSSNTTSVCTVSGTTVHIVSAGTCTIQADQAGNFQYSAASPVTQSFAVAKANQTVSFTSTNPSPVTYTGSGTYTPAATATSGLSVVFTIDGTSTSGACTIASGVVSFTGAGTCIIDANQGGNGNYNAAPQVQQTVVINKANQTISFTSTNPSPVTFGAGQYTPTATATSTLAVAFTIDGASTSGACTFSAGKVTFTGAGTCIIDANQSGNGNYNAAPQVQQSITINKADQTITFTSTNPGSKASGTTYTPTATAPGGTVTFTVSGNCTIAGGVVTFTTSGGNCTVKADQAGNANYNAAPQATQVIAVTAAPTITNPTAAAPCNPGHNGTANCTITGTNFAVGVTVTISANGTVNSVTRNSSTQLTINVTGSGGNGQKGNITVTNPDGGSATVTNGFSNG